MLGLDGAGKTTVVKKLLEKDVNIIEPTLGFNIDTIQFHVEPETYNINVWDVGGQKSIRTFWKNYFEKTEGLIWVVDCADRSRLSICRDEMHKVLQHIIMCSGLKSIKMQFKVTQRRKATRSHLACSC